jgi:predicted dehydrogenase
MLTKEAEIVRMRTVEKPDPFAVTIDLGRGRGFREIAFEKPEVPASNAIREELRSFARAVLDDRTPEVPLSDGIAALDVAQRVLAAMQRHTLASFPQP